MDAIRKAMLLGLGAIRVTQREAEQIIDLLIKRGEISVKDRPAMVDRLLREAEVRKSELEGKVAASVQKVMTDVGLPTQKDFKSILKRLGEMEKAMSEPKKAKRGKKV